MEKIFTYVIGILFILESIYFNILYDLLIIFVFLTSNLALGNFFKIKVDNTFDEILIRISLGMGTFGFFIWLTTFNNPNYKSFFILITLFFIFYQIKYLKESFFKLWDCLKSYNTKNIYLIPLLSIFFMFYVINASYPIHTHDALTKHLAIPLKILNNTSYDYNVIESIVFGDYAILPHMFSLFFLSIGGTKALTLFITVISFLLLGIILRISYLASTRNIFINGISLIYLTTPIVYKLSVNLMVETISLFFITISILLISYNKELSKNIIYLGLIFGFAMFTKQISAFYLLPLSIIVLYIYVKEEKILNFREIIKLIFSVFICLLVFLPSIIIIYAKTGNPFFPFMNGKFQSPYFSISDFKDPFNNILGFNFDSLWSIVFHTTKNIEMINGGIGYVLIFLPLVFLFIFFKRNKIISIFLFTALLGYIISTYLTYNIRYFFPSIVFLFPVIWYYLVFIDERYFSKRNIFSLLILIFSIVSSFYILFDKDNYWGFKPYMLKVKSELTENGNSSVLKYIPNEKDIRILSNNDQQRGDFIGEYYGLGWYNTYLCEQIEKENITPENFLSNFDYYLVSKVTPLKYGSSFNPDSPLIKEMLTLIHESETHKIYKINKEFDILVDENFIQPIIVSAIKPETRRFSVSSSKYQIQIKSEKKDNIPTLGRFQINWLDKDGKFIDTAISTYELKDGINNYSSSLIENIPVNAKFGEFYINSHNNEIKVYSFKLLYFKESNFLDNILDYYFKRI